MPRCWRSAPMPRRCWRSTSACRSASPSSAGGLITAVLGTLLIFPSFRLRGHYVSIATLAIGEIVSLVILNWESLTRGPIGISGIPPLSLFGYELDQPDVGLLVQLRRAGRAGAAAVRACSRSHLGRTLARGARRRRGGARLRHQPRTATRRWPSPSAASPPASAAASPRTSTPTSTTRPSTRSISILALTIVILGGLGNVVGAIVGAVAAGRPARGVPRRGRIPHADLRPRPAAADPLPAAGPAGHGLMAAHAPLLSLRGLTRRFGGLTAVDGSISTSPRASSSASSARTAPARRRCSTSSPASTGRMPARSRFDGRDITGLVAGAARGARRRAHLPARPRVRQSQRARQRPGRRAHALARRAAGGAGDRPARWNWRSRCCGPASVKAEEERLREEAKPSSRRFGERLLPRIDHPAYSLSYANRRRVEIARALALQAAPAAARRADRRHEPDRDRGDAGPRSAS